MMLFRPIYYSQAGEMSGGGGGGVDITQINGNTGSAFGPTVTITTGAANTQGTSVFTGNGVSTITQTFSDNQGNTGLGASVFTALAGGGNNTALGARALQNQQLNNKNVAIGTDSLNAFISGLGNTAVGSDSCKVLNGSNFCTSIGFQSMMACLSGDYNTAVGINSLVSLAGGAGNTAIGVGAASAGAGSAYTGGESSNLVIANAGVVGDSNTIRLGASHTKNFQAGIAGVTIPVANRQNVVIDSVTGQLGSGTATQLFPWTDASGAFTAAINNGYFLTAASTPTLPAAPVQGDEVIFFADTAGSIVITANAGQQIRLGNVISAVAGTATNTAQGDSLTLVYRAATTTWCATAVVGIFNVI